MTEKIKASHVESLLFLAMSAGLFTLSIPNIHLRILNAAFSSQPWESRSTILSQVLMIYSFVFMVFAILSYYASTNDTTISSQIMILVKSVLATWQKEIFSSIKSIFASRKDVIWLLLAMIIGVGIRGYFLSQPMRSDEASTFMNWVNNGFFSLGYRTGAWTNSRKN